MNIPSNSVIIQCPCCHKETAVVTREQVFRSMEAPVIVDKLFDVSGQPFVDWENVEVNADIILQCQQCSAKLADDLETLFKILKKNTLMPSKSKNCKYYNLKNAKL